MSEEKECEDPNSRCSYLHSKDEIWCCIPELENDEVIIIKQKVSRCPICGEPAEGES